MTRVKVFFCNTLIQTTRKAEVAVAFTIVQGLVDWLLHGSILSSGSKGRDFRTVLSLYLHCPCQSWPVAVELVTFKQLPLTLSNSSCFKRNFSNIALILPSSCASQCCGPPASYSQFCIEHTSHVCKQGFSQVWKKLDIQNPYRPCLLAWTVSWIVIYLAHIGTDTFTVSIQLWSIISWFCCMNLPCNTPNMLCGRSSSLCWRKGMMQKTEKDITKHDFKFANTFSLFIQYSMDTWLLLQRTWSQIFSGLSLSGSPRTQWSVQANIVLLGLESGLHTTKSTKIHWQLCLYKECRATDPVPGSRSFGMTLET